jgi:hypothetical protein
MTTLLHACPTRLEIVAPFLGSETHSDRCDGRGLPRRFAQRLLAVPDLLQRMILG